MGQCGLWITRHADARSSTMAKKKRNQAQQNVSRPAATPPEKQQLDAEGRGQSRHAVFIVLSLVALVALTGTFYWLNHRPVQRFNGSMVQSTNARGKPQFSDFVGSDVCAKCHQKQYELWKKSTHGLA